MLSRKDKIAAIVDNRRRNGELFKQFINWLTNLDNGLLNCKKQFENPEISGQLEAAKLSGFIGSIDNISEKILACK